MYRHWRPTKVAVTYQFQGIHISTISMCILYVIKPFYSNERGRYLVGTSDLMNSDNLLLRCFYPTKQINSPNDHFDKNVNFPPWLPSLQYAGNMALSDLGGL